jgi:hypothetical protein
VSSHCSTRQLNCQLCTDSGRVQIRHAEQGSRRPVFFHGRPISLIEVPVLSPASAHTCAGFLFRYSRRPGRGQTGLRPAFGWGPARRERKAASGPLWPAWGQRPVRARFLRQASRPTSIPERRPRQCRFRLAVARTGAAMTLAMFYPEAWQLGDRGGVNRDVRTGRTISPAHARAPSRAPKAQRRGAQDIGSDGERPRSSLDRGGRTFGSGARRAHRAATP